MGTLEGDLVRAWRQHFGLTLEGLGELCPESKGRGHIADIEAGRNRASIPTLLNLIAGFERSPNGFGFGSTDARKLGRFFHGPGVEDVLARAGQLERDLRALRKERTR